ncbi:MAG: hypothetical protein M1541_03475 [Acidobacteria bacterium]|nr:hypothetical protein [Acidobacteriota bacterium]
MTPEEIRIVEALARCSFAPGTSPKRFVHQMAARAANSRSPLTDRQRAYLWAVAWSWRRQLPRALADLASEYSGGVGIRGRQVLEERYRDRVATVTQQRARVAPAREQAAVVPTPRDDRQEALFA